MPPITTYGTLRRMSSSSNERDWALTRKRTANSESGRSAPRISETTDSASPRSSRNVRTSTGKPAAPSETSDLGRRRRLWETTEAAASRILLVERATPGVDRLVLVADRAERPRPLPEELDQGVLRRIRVLVLVHQEVLD